MRVVCLCLSFSLLVCLRCLLVVSQPRQQRRESDPRPEPAPGVTKSLVISKSQAGKGSFVILFLSAFCVVVPGSCLAVGSLCTCGSLLERFSMADFRQLVVGCLCCMLALQVWPIEVALEH